MAKMKSITTKQGDGGLTRLFSGEKVSKNSPRINSYGDIDELVSILGIARQQTKKADIQEALLFIQRSLFIAASELATTSEKLSWLKNRIDNDALKILDDKRDALEKIVTIPNGFIVPANTLAASYIDYARAVSRRCERKIIALLEKKIIANTILLIWFNRLSDYLYLLARCEEGSPLMVKS